VSAVSPKPRFRPGDEVRVRHEEVSGHVRTPSYIRGRCGVVERLCGAFANPEDLAYGRPGLPPRPLYRVRFLHRDVWPDYDGHCEDTLDVEVFEHWLEPATPPAG